MAASNLMFAKFDVSSQCFFRSAHAFAIANIKPIVPGHVLVIPNRIVGRLGELNAKEVGYLFAAVQEVGKTIEKAYGASSLTIACQV